ncbi:HEAT repeat domain-containing protein [Streptomyces sp. NPDC056231]|uniref:HEAT repeat domain-containing protein n=1 Tax=Streptomyces sp. NPDC056231 TaxID=3345755 RepID=UPI003AB0392D
MDDDTAPTRGDQVSLRAACPPAVNEALKRLAATTRHATAEFEQALFGLALLCAEAPVEALELLVSATAAPDAMLRRAGIEGLGIFGPDAVAHAPIIAAALSDPDPDVRAAAHVSLKAVLRRNEPDEELRTAVRRAAEQSSNGSQPTGSRETP